MHPKPTPTHAAKQAFDAETYREVFGLERPEERQWAERLLKGIAERDAALLPPAAEHPFLKEIAAGPASIMTLASIVATRRDRERLEALDALAFIFAAMPEGAPPQALALIRGSMPSEAEPSRRAYFLKTLALGQDSALIAEQLRRLADPDPALVASAARLLGFARCRAAAPILADMVAPARAIESRFVIWALGEIGAAEALPALYRALQHGFRAADCCLAIGKIGQITSVPALMPALLQGLPEVREAAARGLATILDGHREHTTTLRPLFETIGPVFEQLLRDDATLSVSARLHLLLGLARIGRKLDGARVRRYLDLALEKEALDAKSAFFANRRRA